MSLFSSAAERFKALFFRRRQERELAEELRFHVDREMQERIRAGEAPDAARRAALLAFGGVENYKEEVRDARGVRPLEELGADLRYAMRGLRRNPGFTATAVLVLGLGLGATTAVFSIMYSVVLADLPYPESNALVMVFEQNSPTNRWNISTADVAAMREQQQSFSAWGPIAGGRAELSGTGSPERIALGRISAGAVRALGVPAVKGRLILDRDEDAAAPSVVVVSHALAQRVLGGADGAVGRSLTLDGVSHTVIGVLPPSRDDLGGVRATAWAPLKLRAPARRGPFGFRGIGRLKPGATIATATRDLSGVSTRLLGVWADFRDSAAKLTPIPLRETIIGTSGRQVGLFAGAVLMVLLLAIINVATLVLVRASARETEVGVRVMLGASRARIARLLVTENLLLTFAAAVVGLVLAMLGLKLAVTQLPNLPRIQDATLDWRAVAFAVSAAVVSGILVSLSPILSFVGRAAGSLRADSRRAGTSRRTNAVRGALVTAEFALALPLLVGAGLLLNSFVRLQQVDPGFDPVGMASVGVSLPGARYPDSVAISRFWRLIEQRMAETPGVLEAGLASNIPPDNTGGNNNFNLVDHPVPLGQSEPTSPWFRTTPGYFRAMGIRVLDGRLYTPADTIDPVIVVTRSWARHFFPNEQPVGRQLISGGCYDCPRTTIIGVVADVKNFGLAGAEETIYEPMNPFNTQFMNLVVRSNAGSVGALRALRENVRALDPELPLIESTFIDRFRDSLADPRRWTTMLSAFAVTGVVLAALGIFGLMSYVVRQRRREIGVRLALGAQPSSVARLIVGRGMRYAVVGSAIGIGLTFLLASRIKALLFGVGATDALTIAAVSALLLSVAFVACWLPGRRAARILPLEAISAE